VRLFVIIGYAWILENDPITAPKSKILGSGNKQWVANLNTVIADSAELVTDLAYSDRVSGKFDSIISGGSGGTGAGIPESSSHIRNSYSVYGSNIGFCDGHVEWRPFNQMEKRWAWAAGRIFGGDSNLVFL